MTVFKLGINKKTGKTVSIQEVAKGLQCDCICPDCQQQFVAAQGEKNEWHFRHYEETNCKGGQETALHRLAKEIIVSNTQFELPNYGTVIYESPESEKSFLTFKPDITAKINGQDLFFEIFVTHAVDRIKETFFRNGEHKSVEINFTPLVFSSHQQHAQQTLQNQ